MISNVVGEFHGLQRTVRRLDEQLATILNCARELRLRVKLPNHTYLPHFILCHERGALLVLHERNHFDRPGLEKAKGGRVQREKLTERVKALENETVPCRTTIVHGRN